MDSDIAHVQLYFKVTPESNQLPLGIVLLIAPLQIVSQ